MKRTRIRNNNRLASCESVCELLNNTKWSNDFTWNQLVTISRYLKAEYFERDTIIFDEGDIENYMGIIVKGKIGISKLNGENSVSLATLRPSQTIGEISMIDSGPRSAKAVALDDVTMLIVTMDSIMELGRKNSTLALEFYEKVAQMLAARLRMTSGKLINKI